MTRFLFLFFVSASAFADPWSGIIDPARAINWGLMGATIVERSQCGSEIAAGASTATINSAISSCSNGYVKLGAGTFNLTGLSITHSNVTLRGAGADQTSLVITGAGVNCGGYSAGICVSTGASIWYPDFTKVDWTGTHGNSGVYTRGSTVLNLSSVTGLATGRLLLLGQTSDGSKTNDPADGVFVCDNTDCTQNGYGNSCCGPTSPASYNAQHQFVMVTAINGTAVTIKPGIYMPNWRTAKSPTASWGSANPISAAGIEDLSIDMSGSSAENTITFGWAYNSWVRGIRAIKPASHHVKIAYSKNITVRDSYFFEGQSHGTESYGIDMWGGSDCLIENNIFQRVTNPYMNESGSGIVYGYNYSTDNIYSVSSWLQAGLYTHAMGNNFHLWESNDVSGMTLDDIWGAAHFMTMFRNRSVGYDDGRAGLTDQTVGLFIYAWNRHENVIGNVLGLYSYHTNYEYVKGSTGNPADPTCNHTIYVIGYGANCASDSKDDTRAGPTLMRWGNWDIVSSGTYPNGKFASAEVPSGQTYYPNPVPATQVLPASFYLGKKPAWFGSVPWPAIGPDVNVTSGEGGEANVGNHNAKIPARRCAESIGVAIGQTTARTFNAVSCYGTYVPQAAPPTNVIITQNRL